MRLKPNTPIFPYSNTPSRSYAFARRPSRALHLDLFEQPAKRFFQQPARLARVGPRGGSATLRRSRISKREIREFLMVWKGWPE
jgi:hypothetical protein